MSILFLDRIKSGIPTTIIEGKDVSEVLLINPDPNLPPFFLANKAVLRTASKKIDVYDADGVLDYTLDISETDLSDINDAIDAVDGRVDETNDELEKNVAALNLAVKANTDLITLADAKADDAKGVAGNALSKANNNAEDISGISNDVDDLDALVKTFDGRITDNHTDAKSAHDRADSAHSLATSAQTEAALNTTNIAALDGLTANQTKNIKELQARTDKQTHDIHTVKRKARSNQLSIDTLEAQMDKQIEKNKVQDGQIETLDGNVNTLAEDTTKKFTTVSEALNQLGLNDEAFEAKIKELDAEDGVLKGEIDGIAADVGIIQDELAVEGLGGIYRQGNDIETGSISSNGSGFIDELYVPPSPEPSDIDDKPQPIGGTYQYHVVNENGSYTKLLSFDKDGLDMSGKQVSNVASGQGVDTNAANIGDVKRLIEDTPDNGLVPTDNKWDMDGLPVVNAGSIGFNEQISSSGDGASYARFTTGSLELGASSQVYFEVAGVTVGDVNRTRANFSGTGSVLGKNTPEGDRSPYELINWETLQAYPDSGLVPTNDVWNMTGYPLDNVPSVGFKTDREGARVGFEQYRTNILADTIRFVTQNDSGEYGNISASGLSLNDLEIKGVRESTTENSAATVGQVNAVHTKVDNLTIPEDLAEEVQANTDEIASVKATAQNADNLSKTNQTDIAGIKSNYVQTGTTATLNAVMFGGDTKIDHQDELGLVLQGDTIYGKSQSGYEHFFIEDGNFNVKSKKIQKVRDGEADDDAVTLRQLKGVKTTAEAADTLSKANAVRLDGLVIPPDSSAQVSQNTTDIANVKTTADNADALSQANAGRLDALVIPDDLSDDVAKNTSDISSVSATATAADTLSKSNKDRLDALVIPPDNSTQVEQNKTDIAAVKTTADNADNLSKTNATTLENALIKDEYGWGVDNLNIYNVSRLSRTDNAVNSSGLSIGDADVNLHADTVGITNSNSATTYAVFSAAGLNLNDYPLTRMASGGDTDTNAANIGDVKRIAASTTPNLDGYAQLDSNVSFTQIYSDDIRGSDVGNLSIINLGSIARNHTNDANSVTLGNGSNTYKSNEHSFITNSSVELLSIDNTGLDVKGRTISGLASGGDDDGNAANISDVKRIAATITPDLEGYAKLDDTVQFSRVKLKNDFASDSKEPYLWCDPANGNTVFGATGSVYFNQYDHEGNKHRWAIVDSSNRMTLDNAAKVQRLMNKDTWSTDSSNEHAGFIRWDLDKRIVVGAKQDVTFQVNGKDVYKVKENGIDFTGQGGNVAISHDHNIDVNVNGVTNVAFKDSGMKLLRDVDAHSQNINNMGDISFGSNYALLGKSNHNLAVLNSKGIFSKASSSDNAQSVELTDTSCFITATNTYVRTHNGGTILKADQSGFDFKNKPLKAVAEAQNETDVPNLGQVQTLVDGLGAGLKFETYKEHPLTSGMTIFENQGEINTLVDYTHPSGNSGVNFDISKQGQSTMVGVRNLCQGTGAVTINVSLGGGNGAEGIGNVKCPAGHMFIFVFDADLGKSYYIVSPFRLSSTSHYELAEDIELDDVNAGTLFLTGDQGILESYNEDGENKLRPVEGYNIPKQEQDIEELKSSREANAPITQYFKNESIVTVPYTQDHPVAEVWVLDTTKTINGASLSLVDDNTHKYSGVYNTVGSISLTGNKWTNYSYHNAFKHSSENYYVVYDFDFLSWVIVEAQNPHTSLNEDINSVEKISLNHKGQLPQSYGDYTINLSIEDLDSLEFIKAEANTRIDTDARVVIVDFGLSKPSGKVIIK